MIWYYAQEGKRVGPVDDAELAALVETAVIQPETLVWNETLTNWVKYAELDQNASQSQARPYSQEMLRCNECGRSFSRDEMISYQQIWICAGCKPLFLQKIREGVHHYTDFVYAGFWIRVLAKIIDIVIQWTVSLVLMAVLFFVVGGALLGNNEAYWMFSAAMNIFQLVSFAFAVFYTTFFIGKFGATPGKMILGLRVVVADGSKVSYARALGRHFAEWLSIIILYIGYIIAAFDDEKRTLHDRICETRVIKKSS